MATRKGPQHLSLALEPVPLLPSKASKGGGGYGEAWLQEMLFRHPEILPIREIEPGFADLVSICRELPTPHGSIDNLFMTVEGDLVIVEAKLWRNPQARREAVAQALDYASCLFAMSYERFEEAVLRGDRGSNGKLTSLYALFADMPDALTEASFVDAVSANLSRGRIVVLVVGDGIRAETEHLVSILQSHAGFHFTFALVELAVFRMPAPAAEDSTPYAGGGDTTETAETFLVLPRTLTRTAMIERGIVRVEANGTVTVKPPPAVALPASAPPSPKPIPPVPPGSITAEQFFEAMAVRDPQLPEILRAFLARLENLGVFPDFQRTLNLKWEAPTGRLVNLGYIRRGGQVWTDAANWHAPKKLSHAYIEDVAAAWGGEVDRETFGENWHVRVSGKAPRIETLIPYLDAWYACIVRFLRALQAAGEDDTAEGTVEPQASPISEVDPEEPAGLKPVYHDPEKVGCTRTALAALAKHLPTFRDPNLVIGTTTPAKENAEGVIVMGFFSLGHEATALMSDAYAYGWVREFYWMPWSQTPEGARLMRDPAALAQVDDDDLARVVTVCMREAHWGPEALEHRFHEGLLTRVLERAAMLHAELVVMEMVKRAAEPATRTKLLRLVTTNGSELLSFVSPWQAIVDTVQDPRLRSRMQETLDARPEGYEGHLTTLMEQANRT